MKIVIANSIGKDRSGNYIIHSPSRWSESVKSKAHWFAYYPWELAYLTALLKKETDCRVKMLDGCLLCLDKQAYLELILSEYPDLLVIESATRMISENLELAQDVKAKLGTKLVFVGQHASAFSQELLEKGVDYVCVGEYEFTVLDIVKGKERGAIAGLYPNERRPLLDVNALPWPEDEDVSRLEYAFPGEPSSEFKEIQMYASRGCPGSCNFCVARNVYYDQPNWRPRNVQDIISEIKYLKEKYPSMEGVFFDEEVHNAGDGFIIELTKAIIDSGLNSLRFEAMCDARFLNEKILRAMKAAGYYKIRIGIETASKDVMRAIGKTIDAEKISSLLKLAKKIGLKTYGTFTFGAPGSDKDKDENTINHMKRLITEGLLDNLQLSICTPQPGTPFYAQAREQGVLRDNISFDDYDGGRASLVNYPGYSSAEIEAMKEKALTIRDHYFMTKRIKEDGLWEWVLAVFVRYGFKRSLIKIFRRLKSEFDFFLKNIDEEAL